jgi:hypothetical protein
MPVVLTFDWASGLITVTVRAPGSAVRETVMFIVICVWSVNVVLFTVTPPPFTRAEIWLGYPVPGSKNAETPDEVPRDNDVYIRGAARTVSKGLTPARPTKE